MTIQIENNIDLHAEKKNLKDMNLNSSHPTHVEYINHEKLKIILSNRESLGKVITDRNKLKYPDDDSYDPFLQAEKMEAVVADNKITVRYKQKDGHGRLFAVGGVGLQATPREIRHTIAGEFYDDIDIVNAHPVILEFLCKKHDIECKHLSKYIEVRDSLFEKLTPDDKAYLKHVFLSLTNGGTRCLQNRKIQAEFVHNYAEEMAHIHEKFAEIFSDEFEAFQESRIAAGRTWNIKAGFMNSIICDAENEILDVIFKFYGSPLDSVLCFDGIMLKKGSYDPDSLSECAKSVYEHMGISVSIVLKPMDSGFDLKGLKANKDDKRAILRLLSSPLMDEDYAEFFVAKYDSFRYFDGHVYQFKDGAHTWIKDDESLLYEFLGTTVYSDIRKVLDVEFNTIDNAAKHGDLSKALAKRLRCRAARKGIVLSILPKIKIDHDAWDQSPHLIGFNNGIFDLKTGALRNGQPEDMVATSVGYDWTAPDSSMIGELMAFIDKIMPHQDERDVLLKAMASGLYGQVVQNFFILTGEGSNGKDTLMSKLFKATLGKGYFEYSNTSILTEKRKGSLCQEIRNLNKKRTAIWNEPPKQSILQGAPIKEITGANEINARGLYSDNTETQLKETCFMLCNDIPRIDNVDPAVARRIVVIPFRALFKNPDDIAKMKNTEFVHEVDRYYDSDSFRSKYKMTLFHILADYFKRWEADDYLFKYLPETIKQQSSQYLRDSDDFIGWFHDTFCKVENDEMEREFVQVKDVYQEFKRSDLYENLSKRERRLMTRSKLEDQIRKHPELRGSFEERLRKHPATGAACNIRSVLMGFKKRLYEESLF